MKTPRKLTIAACILSIFGLASCKTSGGSPEGRHSMGTKTNSYPMADKEMPGNR